MLYVTALTQKRLENTQAFLVGVPRFELGTPCSQSRCANRTALHPDCVELFSFCGAKILHFFDSTTKLPQLFAILRFFHRLPVLFPHFFKSCLTKCEIVYFKKQDSSRHSRLHARNTEFSFNFGNAFEREVCCARQNAAHILRRHT